MKIDNIMGVITQLRQHLISIYKSLYSFETLKTIKTQAIVQEKIDVEKLRLYTLTPVIFIAIAELLIFSGRILAGIWVHSGTIIFLSLSNNFIQDTRVHKIFMPLILLPVLRIVNLSMPILFDSTLYSFILYYIPLVIPVGAMVIYQRNSFEEIGVTTKNFMTYLVISIPLSCIVAFGEYLVIRPVSLISDFGLVNLFKVTIVMVFLVGLIEELIFRSILQTRLEQMLGIQDALVITSFLFGIMHSGYGTFNEIIYTSIVGLLMGSLFYKTKNLPFIALTHGLINVFLFGIFPFYLIN